MDVTPTALRAQAIVHVGVVQASLVGSSVLAGLFGVHVTRGTSVEHRDGSIHSLWSGAVPSAGRVAALEAVGSLPVAAPFAILGALIEPEGLTRRPLRTWVLANLIALGVSPAAAALGSALLHGEPAGSELATAALVGQITLVGVQSGVALLMCTSLALMSTWPVTREAVPTCLAPLMRWSRQWAAPAAAAPPTPRHWPRGALRRVATPAPPYDHALEPLPGYSSRRNSLAQTV